MTQFAEDNNTYLQLGFFFFFLPLLNLKIKRATHFSSCPPAERIRQPLKLPSSQDLSSSATLNPRRFCILCAGWTALFPKWIRNPNLLATSVELCSMKHAEGNVKAQAYRVG
ncbi:unnamed protein product, partial [Vitis vinifera]